MAAAKKPASKNTKSTGSRTTSKASGGKGSSGKSSGARTSAKKTPAGAKQSDQRLDEIKLFVYLAVSVFLLCSNFGWCGIIGDFFSSILFGLFGTVSYVIPVYLFLSAAFLLANGAMKKVVKRVLCAGIFLVVAAFIFQFAAGLDDMSWKILYDMGASEKKGGGALLGGILVLLSKGIGMTGCVIITVLLAIIGIIVVLDVSIIEAVKNKARAIAEFASYEDDEDDEEYDDTEYAEVEDEKKSRVSMKSITVIEDDEAAKKRVDKEKKKNKIVKNEEVHELKPEKPDLKFDIPVPKVKSRDFFEVDEVNEAETAQGLAENEKEFEDLFAEPPKDDFGFDAFDDDIELKLEKNLERNNDKKTADTKASGMKNADADIVRTASGKIIKKNPPAYNPETDSAFEVNDADTADLSYATSKDENQHDTQHKKRKTRESQAEVAAGTAEVADVIANSNEQPIKKYKFPPLSLLQGSNGRAGKNNEAAVRETAIKLKNTLETFGVKVTITDYSCGPSVTRYELQPEMGVKVSKIVGLADDIKLNLAASDIRIEAPIPGKAAIGIEVPNKESSPVYFRDLLESDEFKNFKPNLAFAVGKDISGKTIVADIAKMPHLLIAGATGSGKSVCINTLIMSVLYKAKPDDVKLIMVDPKQVELSVYNGLPHMLIPVVTDPKKAAGALNWAVVEMTKRYQLFSQYNVRNLQGYNDKVKSVTGSEQGNEELPKLPQILIIVDELADLMMVAHGEVEDAIVRLSQLARAAGIHLVIATQRPSVDVITGLIKANVPSRIAMTVSSGVDSRTIIDMVGAEKLLGKGDMLFYPTGYPKPVRVQGAFLTDEEISDVVDFIKEQSGETVYDEKITSEIASTTVGGGVSSSESSSEYDDYFVDAGKFIIQKDKASIGMLQRMYKIGFNRAARIMDQLSDAGVVGPEEGTKPRKIIMSLEEFENFVENEM
jgi:S-DNA-T family DNA segregation ATPase FtsK/SpoIIIE